MAIVAALFDDDASATKAMDQLLNEHLHNIDTRVIEPGQYSGDENVSVVGIPNTGAGSSQPGLTPVPLGMTSNKRLDWLDKLDKVETTFYYEGLKEGATLTLVKVDDDDAQHVRELLHNFGARTYVKD